MEGCRSRWGAAPGRSPDPGGRARSHAIGPHRLWLAIVAGTRTVRSETVTPGAWLTELPFRAAGATAPRRAIAARATQVLFPVECRRSCPLGIEQGAPPA